MTSIALPAIGAGGLGYPHDVVAKTMVDEIREFRRQHPTSALDVTVIVRVDDASVIQVTTSFAQCTLCVTVLQLLAMS